MTEEPTNHFQRGTAGEEERREGVAEVVDADVGDLGLQAHWFPEALQVDAWLAWASPGKGSGHSRYHGLHRDLRRYAFVCCR